MWWYATLLLVTCRFVFSENVHDLPSCGQNCINGRVGALTELGCNIGDVFCYCVEEGFELSINACSDQNCSAANAQVMKNWVHSYCASASTNSSASATSMTTFTLSSSLMSSYQSITSFSTATLIIPSPAGSIATASPSPTRISKPGLSSSAKVGIGVGIPLGILAAASTFAVYWLHSRRYKAISTVGGKADGLETGEPDTTDHGAWGHKRYDSEVSEPDAMQDTDGAQLRANHILYEIDGLETFQEAELPTKANIPEIGNSEEDREKSGDVYQQSNVRRCHESYEIDGRELSRRPEF